MSTKIETTVAELPRTLVSYPGDRRIYVEIEESDEEKIEEINAMLKRSRASGAPIDGEKALAELRDSYLAAAKLQAAK
jgi:hypothetical protein